MSPTVPNNNTAFHSAILQNTLNNFQNIIQALLSVQNLSQHPRPKQIATLVFGGFLHTNPPLDLLIKSIACITLGLTNNLYRTWITERAIKRRFPIQVWPTIFQGHKITTKTTNSALVIRSLKTLEVTIESLEMIFIYIFFQFRTVLCLIYSSIICMLNQDPVPKKSNQSHSTNTGTHMQVPCLHINFRDVYLTKKKNNSIHFTISFNKKSFSSLLKMLKAKSTLHYNHKLTVIYHFNHQYHSSTLTIAIPETTSEYVVHCFYLIGEPSSILRHSQSNHQQILIQTVNNDVNRFD